MRFSKLINDGLDRAAQRVFNTAGGPRRRPHPVFLSLYERLAAELSEAEVCLHPDVTSRPNLVEVFFEFGTWTRLVSPREARVYRAIEAEIEAHRTRNGYAPDERIVLRLFVADPEQRPVAPNRPEVVARCVADPEEVDAAWSTALKHTTVVGGRRPARAIEAAPSTWIAHAAPPSTRPTPLAILKFSEGGVERTAELAEPGVFGRGAGSDVCVHVAADDGDPAEVVSRRALVFGVSPMTGVVEIENAGRVALAVSGAGGPSIFAPATTVSVREAAVFTWPNDDRDGFRLSVETPSRGLLVLRSDAGEQQVVLRAPRTPVRADPALFGAIDVFFHVDFVDGTGFLVLNNEGSVPLRFGSFEGKQLQWPVDAPREIEAGPLRIEIHLTGAE